MHEPGIMHVTSTIFVRDQSVSTLQVRKEVVEDKEMEEGLVSAPFFLLPLTPSYLSLVTPTGLSAPEHVQAGLHQDIGEEEWQCE